MFIVYFIVLPVWLRFNVDSIFVSFFNTPVDATNGTFNSGLVST